MSEEHRDNRVRAQKRKEAIAQLRSAPAFTGYYTERLQKRVSDAFDEMMQAATPQTLWEARLIYLERTEQLNLVDADEIATEAIIGPNKDASDL